VVFVRDDAILPQRFLDELIATQVTLGVDRLQPAHHSGPGGWPARSPSGTGGRWRGRCPGARPCRALGAGRRTDRRARHAQRRGHRRLRAPLRASGDARLARHAHVGRRCRPPTGALRPAGAARSAPDQRADLDVQPRASSCGVPAVVRQADARPLRVRGRRRRRRVDEGGFDALSPTSRTTCSWSASASPTAGRSAAKNHCVLLARAPIVLFFDDDDRAAPTTSRRTSERTTEARRRAWPSSGTPTGPPSSSSRR
jgi:hypothetical protein